MRTGVTFKKWDRDEKHSNGSVAFLKILPTCKVQIKNLPIRSSGREGSRQHRPKATKRLLGGGGGGLIKVRIRSLGCIKLLYKSSSEGRTGNKADGGLEVHQKHPDSGSGNLGKAALHSSQDRDRKDSSRAWKPSFPGS